MPIIEVNGAKLYYEDSGGASDTILFCHGLICNCHMFDDQVKAFKDRFRCITFDFRGHGNSEVTRNGYDMDNLAVDAVKLIQELNCKPCHLVGFSMGGFVALRLAIHYSNFFQSLILMNTSAGPFPKKDIFQFKMLSFIGRWIGFRPIVNQLMSMMFSDSFLKNSENIEKSEKWRQYVLNNSRKGGVRAVNGVIGRKGVYDQLNQIRLPSLIIASDQDKLADRKDSIRMHEKISNSKMVIIPHAGHMTAVESFETVNATITNFLTDLN